MGSPCLFTRQRALKMRYFYWLRVKNQNHPYTELCLGYPKDKKFYFESKASFIDISSIASFRLFLVAWFRKYCTFFNSSVVSLKSWPWTKYIQQGTIFQKKLCSTIKPFFASSKIVLSKYKEKIGGHRACLRERGIYFAIQLSLREISYVLNVHKPIYAMQY